jgi:hypothetical protein
MPSMDITLELSFGKEASEEIILSVDFSYKAGSPANYGSLTYPGHPAEPPEVEIETIFWPVQRFDKEKRAFVADHLEITTSLIPDKIYEAMVEHICLNYEEDH